MTRYSVNLIPAIAAVCACLLFSNCRKKDDGPSETRRNLVGSWKVTAVGADQNGNKMPDLDEIVAIPESTSLTNVFNEDGTGSGMISSGAFPVSTTTTWELSNEDKTLKVIYSTSGIAITRYYQMITITPSVMTMADTTLSPWTFMVSTKQ